MLKIFPTQKIREIFFRNVSITVSVIGILVGAILAYRYQEKLPRIISPGVSYLSLQDMELKLEKEQADLKNNTADAANQINSLEEQTKKRQVGLTGLVEETDKLKKDAGVGALSGEGITIYLADSDSREFTPNSIAHASDMRDLVNYLWLKGAKAISIEGAGSKEERVGPTTSIDCIVNTVLINGTKIVPPFQIKAIGNRQELNSAIVDKIALKQIYDRVEKEGLKFYVVGNINQIDIPQFTGNILTEHVTIK